MSDSEGSPIPSVDEPRALADLVNRVLDRGVVVGGDVTISLAGVDLVFLRLSALLTSVATARDLLRAKGGGEMREGEERGGELEAARTASPDVDRYSRDVAAMQPQQRRIPPPSPGDAAIDRRVVANAIADELVQVAEALPSRVDVDPDSVQRDLARLVLVVIELLRRIIEHQAVRRMDDADLSAEQVERMGTALRNLDEKLAQIREVFGLADEDLNLDLGPLGKVL